MNPTNFQLKTILHSYQDSDLLIFSNSDQNFYHVRSQSNLSNKEYITETKEVANKVKKFFSNNRALFDSQLLQQFSNCLDKRFSILKDQTKGFLGLLNLFLLIFNPLKRKRLNEQKSQLQELIQLIKGIQNELSKRKASGNTQVSVSTHAQPSKNSGNLPPQTSIINPIPTQINGSSGSHQPNPPLSNLFSIPNNAQTLLDNLSPLPSNSNSNSIFTSPSPNVKTRRKLFETPPSKIPSSHFTGSNFPPPPPPPPPPLLPTLTIKSSPKPLELLPHEPKPLSFDRIKFSKLPLETISAQHDQINQYLVFMNQFFKPIETYLKDNQIDEEIKNNNDDRVLLTKQIAQCDACLDKLLKGEANNEIVILFYIEQKNKLSFQFPFYPSSLKQDILEECAHDKCSSTLPFFEISEAMKRFQKIRNRLNKMLTSKILENPLLEKKKQQIEKDCLQIYGKSFDSLANLMKEKRAMLNVWESAKTSRKNVIDRLTAIPSNDQVNTNNPQPTNVKKTSSIFEKHEVLKSLKQPNQNFLILLKSGNFDPSLIDDNNTNNAFEAVIDNFDHSIYGQLQVQTNLSS